VWVWLNEKQIVDDQVLDNYFDRKQLLVPEGAIELQTHGSEILFRNIHVREISPAEAKAALDKVIASVARHAECRLSLQFGTC
jgi:hypothetical protein